MAGGDHRPAAPPPLSPGRGAPPREGVEDIQRARIISAMVEVAADVGYLGAAVAPVVARAGVSRRTFYELFDGREDCFLAAFDWAVEQLRGVILQACSSRRGWRERARHALAAALVLLDSEPELARVCVIEALGAGKVVLARRAAVLDDLIAALDAEAPRARGAGAPLLTAEGVVGGALAVIHGRLLDLRIAEAGGEHDGPRASSGRSSGASGGRAPGPLMELHGQLMALFVFPYLGPRAAGEELTRPAPETSQHTVVRERADGRRLLDRLEMRLTYRTVRCLMFIGEHPGSSNREIAEGAEVPDEGQTSKLLSRLTGLDLVANSRPSGPGLANRWTLSERGEQVLSAVRGR